MKDDIWFLIALVLGGFCALCWIAYLDYKDAKNRLDLAKEYFKQQDENKDSRK